MTPDPLTWFLCPCTIVQVDLSLVGSKKIQQELCRPGVVERYLAPDKAAKVRQTFLEMLSMDEVESFGLLVSQWGYLPLFVTT